MASREGTNKKINSQLLFSRLRNLADIKIDLVYDKIKEELMKYSINGHSSAKIYFPISHEHKSDFKYDIRLDDLHNIFNDKYILDELINKIKADGVKVKIYDATIEFVQYGYRYRRYGGKILLFKWRMDYTKKTCIII